MSQLLNIYLDPAKAFAELRERPTFLAPALVVLAALTASMVLYFLSVDPQWFEAHQLAQMQAASPELTKADLEQAAKFMPGTKMLAGITAVTTSIFMAIVFAISALYYYLAGKVSGAALSYRHGLALSTWAAMPMVVGALVTIVGVFTSSPQTSLESLQLLNVDPLFVQLPLDSPWSTLAKSFSLLNFWAWFLAILGWRTFTRSSWGGAAFVVLLPAVVIYGIWALIAAL